MDRRMSSNSNSVGLENSIPLCLVVVDMHLYESTASLMHLVMLRHTRSSSMSTETTSAYATCPLYSYGAVTIRLMPLCTVRVSDAM